MREIVISLPKIDVEHNVEIEVKINGRKERLLYRVELVEIEEDEVTTEKQVTALRKVIKNYDRNWKLLQIGNPEENKIPVMFRKKREKTEAK